jgi:dTMP kinase
MWEVMARVFLELAVVVALVLVGWDFLGVFLGWLAFHTAAWLLLYGGFLKIWVLRGVSIDVGRLTRHLDRVSRRVSHHPSFRVVFLRGSCARGAMTGTSDIDICAVPEPGIRSRVRGIVFWWGLRLESVVRAYPLEARWIDAERYIPYHVMDETPVVLKVPAPRPTSDEPRRPTLVALSGIDGSGKSTAAQALVASQRSQGRDAVAFYGHRRHGDAGSGPSAALAFESIWKRVAGKMDRLAVHPLAKAVYDAATFLDYLFVLGRLSKMQAPGRVVVADRYVADVVAYLRIRGPLLTTIEGLLVAVAPEPDAAFLLELPTDVARSRKAEWPLDRLEQFARAYADLKVLLRLIPIDALSSPAEILSHIESQLAHRTRAGVLPPRTTAAGARSAPEA